MNYRGLVREYFRAEQEGDIEAVVALCAPEVVIRNAAQPPTYGLEGARQYVADFKARTDERRFTVLAMAGAGETVFAWWDAQLTFKAGTRFGPVQTKRPFTVQLQGVCRFKLNLENRVVELDVFHETTTAFRLAQEAAA
jgi:ketosteroid isomerase-like protein